jgi:CheY-like chemotaxis protein
VPGQGSTFVLHLPVNLPEGGFELAGHDLAAAHVHSGQPSVLAARAATSLPGQAVPSPVIQATGPHAALHGKKVLVIDDDQRNAFAITGILEFYGLTVTHASDGETGMQMLRSDGGIDIVLMDVMMPDLDGYATTAAIRHIPEIENVPIIAVTARAMQGDRKKSIDAGANDYVTKPVDTEELLASMERSLGLATDGSRT